MHPKTQQNRTDKTATRLQSLINLPSITGIAVNHNRDQIAFYADFSGQFELYTLCLRNQKQQQRTNGDVGKAPSRAPLVWSADDAYLYFSRDNDGDERQALVELHLASGNIRPLHHHPHSMDYGALAPTSPHSSSRSLIVNSTQNGQLNIYRYDLNQDGKEAWTALTQRANVTRAVCGHPNGEQIAVISNDSQQLKNQDIYLMKADGSHFRRVWCSNEGDSDRADDRASVDSASAWHPHKSVLAIQSDYTGCERVGLLDLDATDSDAIDSDTASVHWLTPDITELPNTPHFDERPLRFSKNGEWLCVLRSQDSCVFPVLYHLGSGQERILQVAAGFTSHADFVLDDQKILLAHSTTCQKNSILLYDLGTDQIETLSTPHDTHALEHSEFTASEFIEAEYLHYPSRAGQNSLEVPALLYRPKNLAQGQKIPALVCVHGGPTDQFFREFDDLTQLLLGQGYAVLCPNIRGSTGYGVKWRDANIQDWGGQDLADVVSGAEFLSTLPEVDTERLGIFGVSFGGYMSYLAAVKHPELFKVSVPIVGISDLVQLHADNNHTMPQLAYYFRSVMGDPERIPDVLELWRQRSAITYADQLKAHMLMLHGANDPRCPLNQASGFKDKLLELGRQEGQDFEYVVFENEGHGSIDRAGKQRMYTLLLDYFSRQL